MHGSRRASDRLSEPFSMSKKLTRERRPRYLSLVADRDSPERFILSDLWAVVAFLVLVAAFGFFIERGGL